MICCISIYNQPIIRTGCFHYFNFQFSEESIQWFYISVLRSIYMKAVIALISTDMFDVTSDNMCFGRYMYNVLRNLFVIHKPEARSGLFHTGNKSSNLNDLIYSPTIIDKSTHSLTTRVGLLFLVASGTNATNSYMIK